MALTPYNIVVEQGDDVLFTITYTDDNGDPIDLSAAKFRMDVKKQISDTHPVWSFNSTGVDVEVDYDGTEPGEPETDVDYDVTLNASGVITVVIDRAFTFKPAVKAGGAFVYDGFLELDGKRRKIITGQITVNKSVTLWEV